MGHDSKHRRSPENRNSQNPPSRSRIFKKSYPFKINDLAMPAQRISPSGLLKYGQRAVLAGHPGAWRIRPSRFAGSGVTSKPGFAADAGRAGSPKGECVKTILNTGRLNRLATRIPPRMLDFTSATAPSEDLRTAQPSPSPRRKSAPSRDREGAVLARELLAPGPSPLPWQRATWRPNWPLHNKERARDVNPLISANPSPVSPVERAGHDRVGCRSLRRVAGPRSRFAAHFA